MLAGCHFDHFVRNFGIFTDTMHLQMKQTTNCTEIKANGSHFGTSDIYFCSHKHINHYRKNKKNEKGLNRAKSYAEHEHEFQS